MLTRKRIVLSKRHPKRVRHCCGLPAKGILQFLSSLILPLMLGVFTVVITFQQQKLAQEQRTEDMNLARQQRLEDRDESQLQREQDRNESHLYREQDRNELQLQREHDKNQSQLQREQDWKIAETARAAQNKAINDQYQDEVFVAYIREMADLLEKNGSFTCDPLIRTIARIKTLNTIRQLDGTRQMHILRFLHEAGQLTNTNQSTALDISTAELIGIDFRKSGQLLTNGEMSLAGVHLVNSTFSDISINNVNFSSARFENVDFSSARLCNVNFSSSTLLKVSFSSAHLRYVNFSSTEFKNVDLSAAEVYNVTFSFCKRLTHIDFSSAQLVDVNFSFAELNDANFSSARLNKVYFLFSELYTIDLSSAVFENVNFSSTTIYIGNFPLTELQYVNFSSSLLVAVNFVSARLTNAEFLSTNFSNINFSSARLDHVDFSSSNFSNIDQIYLSLIRFIVLAKAYGTVSFDYAVMPYTKFDKCYFETPIFSYANLRNASFQNALLAEANFLLANLENTDFTNSTITDNQLKNALSIRNAKLPNGTLGKGRNIVKNGDANCNISLVDHWRVRNGTIVIATTSEDPNQCHFSLQSKAVGAIMSQRIAVIDFWNSSSWPDSTIELTAQMSNGVSIELIGKTDNGTIVNTKALRSTNDRSVMNLKVSMQELELVLKFNPQQYINQSETSWCDNIELIANYGISYEN